MGSINVGSSVLLSVMPEGSEIVYGQPVPVERSLEPLLRHYQVLNRHTFDEPLHSYDTLEVVHHT